MQIQDVHSLMIHSTSTVKRQQDSDTTSFADTQKEISGKALEQGQVIKTTPAVTASTKDYDFTNMTPQEALDASSSLYQSGEISFESNLTIGMQALLALHSPGVNPNKPINFVEVFQAGAEGAYSRGERQHASQLQMALSDMVQKSMSNNSGYNEV